jgi:RNA polymerase sigma factor (sigma-70 family)
MNPSELLQTYARDRDQTAFSLFVQQHFDLVYSAALRQTCHDPHLARDVAQAVFLAAAQHAATLSRHPAITGWLYTSTRYQAAKHIQSQRRWQAREQKAHAMESSSLSATPSDELWQQLRPVLDDALHALNAHDREAILLRYFEGQSYADIGQQLGLAENSARMRIERALEKLRRHLTRHGLTSTATALGAVLSTHTVQAAPGGLALQTATAIHHTFIPATLFSSLVFKIQTMNSLKIATLSLGFATFVGYGLIAATSNSTTTPPSQTAPIVTHTVHATSSNLSSTSNNQSPPPASVPAPATLTEDREPKPSNELLFIRTNDRILLLDTVVKRFDLTPSEVVAIQTDIKRTWDELDAFAAQNATLQVPAPGQAVITISPFSQGAEAYDQLLASIARTLGADRNRLFLSSTAGALEHNLKYCGATVRTLTVEKTQNSQGQFLEYKVTDAWTSAYQRRGKGQRRYKTREAFAQDYPHLAKLLPADFK